jgi:hypothetical protein
MTEFETIAQILLSARDDTPGEDDAAAGTQQTAERRAVVADRLRAGADLNGAYDGDPLLTTLAGLRRQRLELEAAMRRLLAYGREFTRPRPYRLVDLADAAGMSISGVRTAYDRDDVQQVHAATGLRPARPGPAEGVS